MSDVFATFHFLRPLWLLAIPVALLLWWRVRPRRAGAGENPMPGIAPHLAKALTVGVEGERRRFYPIDGIVLIALLLALAAAGPAWTRAPNPLIADTAPLVIALKVTPSMETPDLAPSRLERGKFKILDLVEARAGARTALVAYAGTAHRVSPLTEDPNILRPLLEGLTPAAMPVEGDAAADALELASNILADAETAGAVLFVLDDLSPSEIAGFEAPERPPVQFLVAAPDTVKVPQLDSVPDARVVRLSADDSDIVRIERTVRSDYQRALADDDRLQWEDRGWWLAWPALLLALLWFRRGWTMHWALVLTVLVLAPGTARADGWRDWFLTPDQQGWLAYQDKEFLKAAELYTDPFRKAHALHRAGKYDDAAEIFARLDTAEAAFAEGLSYGRNRRYREAVAAYQKALIRRPDYPEAQQNLNVTLAIIDYVETAREQSDTGEEAGIGADDVVFDNSEGRGQDTQIEVSDEDAPPQTAEQWMSSIDTDMSAFLRSRFLLDNAGGSQ